VVRLAVAPGSIAAGRRIRDLPIGEDTWIALVVRGGRTQHPRGSLVLEPADEVVLLSDPGDETALRHVFTRKRSA
jgi:Trk K+ transport system NAD-binding subunit